MLLLEEERKCSRVISFPDSVFNCFIKSGTFWSRSKRFNLQFSFFGWLTNFHDVNEFFTRFPAVSFVISLSKRPIVHLWSMISEQNSPKGVAYCSRDVGCCANVPKRIVQFHFSLAARGFVRSRGGARSTKPTRICLLVFVHKNGRICLLFLSHGWKGGWFLNARPFCSVLLTLHFPYHFISSHRFVFGSLVVLLCKLASFSGLKLCKWMIYFLLIRLYATD